MELGRIDTNTEFLMSALHLALPREGNFESVLNIVSYIQGNHKSRFDIYPTYPEIDHASFKKLKWVDFYGIVKEAIPLNMPDPRGKDVDLRMYVDSNHSGDKSTRASMMGFLICTNMALIQWLSKEKPEIEASGFGAEFVAMKHGMEKLRGL